MEQPPGVLHLLCCTKSCFAHPPISTRSPGPVSLHAERGVERAITDGPQRIGECASSSGKDTRGALWAEGSSFSALRCQQGLRQVLINNNANTREAAARSTRKTGARGGSPGSAHKGPRSGGIRTRQVPRAPAASASQGAGVNQSWGPFKKEHRAASNENASA